MNEFIFDDYLRSNVLLDAEQRDILFRHSLVREFRRGEFLLREGETCAHRFFIERGAVREYSIDPKGREHLLLFAVEGWFLMNVEGVFFGKPSSYFIQAIEATRIVLLDERQVCRLTREDKVFEELNRNLLYEHIRMLQARITLLQAASAEERYLDFVQAFPEIPLRVPQAMIASYLGITPESLSRIRSDLARRNACTRRSS